MKKDDIKTFITIIIICTLIVGLVLILNRKSNSEKLEVVNDYNSFFTTTNYVNNFLSYSKDSSKLYDVIYSSYIDDNNITKDNIFDYIKSYQGDVSIKVTAMKYVKVKDNYIYYVKGKLYQSTFDSVEVIEDNFEVVVLVDIDTSSYSIYPIDDNDYKDIINGIKKIKIDNNSNNVVKTSSSISKEQMCVVYLSDYIDKLNNDINSAYDVLSNSMKEKYVSLDNFRVYINNNLNRITTDADKCSLEKVKNKRIYTVLDKNSNKYVFVETNIMNYKVDFYLYDNSGENK